MACLLELEGLGVARIVAKGKAKLHLKSKLKRWMLEECVCLRIFSQEAFHESLKSKITH